MQVTLWDQGDHRVLVELDSADLTDRLFEAALQLGQAQSGFWLSYGGHSLLQGVPVTQYGVEPGATVMIHVRARAGAGFSVELSGAGQVGKSGATRGTGSNPSTKPSLHSSARDPLRSLET